MTNQSKAARRLHMQKLGAKGGKATFKKHGRKHMVKLARRSNRAQLAKFS